MRPSRSLIVLLRKRILDHLAVPADAPVFILTNIFGVGSALVGPAVQLLKLIGMNKPLEIFPSRHPVAALLFGGRAVEIIEGIVKDELAGRLVTLPIGYPRHVGGIRKLELAWYAASPPPS